MMVRYSDQIPFSSVLMWRTSTKNDTTPKRIMEKRFRMVNNRDLPQKDDIKFFKRPVFQCLNGESNYLLMYNGF